VQQRVGPTVDGVVTFPPPLAKVVFDKIVSAVLLVVTLPISLFIVLCIAVESALSSSARAGPFHTEVRVSAGRPFKLYKYRILKPVGEQLILDGAVPKAAENDPPNLTRVGAVLKKVGFDESPQLYCILLGQMSFIGPRPLPVPEYREELERGNMFRAQLRAGLSGPAQVMKGTKRTREERTQADGAYAELMRSGSAVQVLRADLKMLAQTVVVVLRATGE